MIDDMNPGDLETDTPVKTLFTPGSWFAKIDFINHLILFNNVLIHVYSDKEGGKSSFSTLLQNNLDQQIQSYALIATQACTKESMIDEIAKQLPRCAGLTDIPSIMAEVNKEKAHLLVIIDDAHYLAQDFLDEAIGAIKNQDDFGFFHFCFISNQSMVTRLNEFKPFNDIIHSIELSALNEHETRTYVLKRLIEKKLIDTMPSDQHFKQFYQRTKGNVSEINNQLGSFSSLCSNQSELKKLKVIKCASIVICAAFVLKGAYWHFNQSNSVENQASQIASITTPATQAEMATSQIPSLYENAKIVQLVQFGINQLPTDLNESPESSQIALIDKVIVIPKIRS